MTLLNWELSPHGVVILSDTLSLMGESKLPRNFMTKIYPVPHLGGVITGTGLGEIVTRFFLAANGNTVARDLEHLSEFAPTQLRAIWNEFAGQIPSDATTTIYTFGLNEMGEFGGFAYRSTHDFEAEPLQHGIAAKPAPKMEQLEAVKSLEDLAKLAFTQQVDDRANSRPERVGIGGDLWLYVLSKTEHGSLSIVINNMGRMMNAEDDFELILAQLPANQGDPYSEALIAEALKD